ncbi:MAG TPA: hypothetical protein ENI95_12810 [Chloroflexi bacterium]|nr:hypothetical protein [Chloroflexota bacterium]
MKRFPRRRRITVWLPFALLALAVLVAPIPRLVPPQEREITISLTQFEFSPARLRVNQGDRVTLTLAASDVVHGFYLEGYGIEERIEPGVTKRIEFVAERRGKFRYRCSVNCGALHPFMVGELIVGPNIPFWRAMGLTLLALAGLLVYLQRTGAGYEEVVNESFEIEEAA